MTGFDANDAEMVTVDYRTLVSEADLSYDGPIERSEAGIPVGNGRVGSLVWTSPTAIRLQANRVDVFPNNSDTSSFNRRDSDHANGCGFVDVEVARAGPDVFAGDDVDANLSVYDGVAQVTGDGVSTRTVAWQDEDVLAIDVRDGRDDPEAISATLRALRPADVETKHHRATSRVRTATDRITLVQEFEEGDFYCSSAIAIGIGGRSARSTRVTETEAKIVAPPENGSVTVFVASAASFDPDEDVVGEAEDRLRAARDEGMDGILAANEAWWEDYWSRAFVRLRSDDGTAEEVERNYTYFLYLMASSSRGPYPPNFGGMLWNTAGDYRRWGGQQWWSNLSLYYRGLFAANRMELIDPLFAMYSGMRDACATAARQQWGSEGLFIPETTWFDGLGDLPEDVAQELRALYLLEKPWEGRSRRFREFAREKHPHNSRWNWKARGHYEEGRWTFEDKGYGPFSEVNHFFATGPELASLYWKRYEYTEDEGWLREQGYPMIRGVVEFFRHYPNLKRDPHGTYHLHHVNHSEPVLGARDTFDALVGLHGLLPVAIRAAEILETDAELRSEWRELLDNLASLPTSDHPDALDTLDEEGSPIWVSGLAPAMRAPESALQIDVRARYYDFDIATLEGAAEGTGRFERAEATYEHYYPEGVGPETRVRVMSCLGTVAARLGRPEDLRWALVNQIEVPWPEEDFVEFDRTGEPAVLPNRMTLREGRQAIGAQRLGNATYGLHEGLCQSVPASPGGEPVIRVFPAWPADWDADFTLLCRGGFLVTSSIREGDVAFVEVQARNGGPCRLRNPWPDDAVCVYRNGERGGNQLDGSLLTVETSEDESIVLVPGDTTPAERSVSIE